MIFLSPFFYISVFSLFVFILFIIFLNLFVYFLLSPFSSLTFTSTLFYFDNIDFVFSLTIDIYSSLFSLVVCLISLTVFIFCYWYFSSFVKITYFIWLTFIFVCSILLLINFSDLFFVILGWDGLGVVSFFLILFYQSEVSVFSSVFTLLINRIGDSLFIVLILLSYYTLPLNGFIIISSSSFILLLFILLAFITNSAIFPFSPWLPAAIAAPTPISSLVHSSTLVTAGLWLIIRNFDFFCSTDYFLFVFVVLGLFTSFYAGLASLTESDLKKVVALSTLSHLGFIMFSIGCGLFSLAFFHLIAHALFKSSLFISLGYYISLLYHYQDSRFLSSLSSISPFFSTVIIISESSLVGFPFCSGFYSNDYVLESFSSDSLSGFLVLVVIINLFFTYSYSIRLIHSLFSPSSISSFNIISISGRSIAFVFLLFFLSSSSVFSGYLVSSIVVLPSFFIIPAIYNFTPIFLLLIIFFLFLILLSLNLTFSSNSYITYLFSSILFLSPLMSNISSRVFVSLSFNYLRTIEYGILYHILATNLINIFSFTSNILYYVFWYSSRFSSVYMCIFIFLAVLVFMF